MNDANDSRKPVVVISPKPLADKPPTYPTIARRMGLQGRVVIRLRVDAEGRASDAVVSKSSGHKILDQAALASVSTWAYQPGTRNGVPTAMTVEAPISFILQYPTPPETPGSTN